MIRVLTNPFVGAFVAVTTGAYAETHIPAPTPDWELAKALGAIALYALGALYLTFSTINAINIWKDRQARIHRTREPLPPEDTTK